ncbi:hypothetical protein ASPACDRAFT_1859780 [Aspergillus aculeatus ATCC 16872]|uniref:Ketopantoate reductase N-terminal domain-containing protein n=1 Tax=Aspergillus aculeatus (strain ATCC 16872 / CBS 172.66 / WB 5094) TaxID=690307 RepID=A0A1L9WIK2_ASPA1|nr:uncharacterized protein ASPACDRAFT_1859780 [Aspergillus aculeatus ATCC 16872]OJJ96011.1 hypothetical protein ASPACDRAFT_1859780 [Aspergillus aculeatus ATCC 16872]
MPSKRLPPRQPRVHVLGLGSIGTFTAHGLNEILPTPPAVTLLLHRETLYDEYLRNSSRTTLHTVTSQTTHHRGYDLEIYNQTTRTWHAPPLSNAPATNPIDHLIVTVKATQTVAALRPLQPRLTASSTILFLQNGCGTIDEVNEHLFPDPATRPNYIVGVISHGVTLNAPFEVTHTGASAISLGKVPRQLAQLQSHTPSAEPSPDPQKQEEYLLQALPTSPLLTAKTYTTYAEILQHQLEKLAVNAFCNPVCALHNAPNKFLFTQPALRRAVLAEISAIVPKLPELTGVEGVAARFALDRLEDTVNTVLERTRETTCSMVVDLRGGRETESVILVSFTLPPIRPRRQGTVRYSHQDKRSLIPRPSLARIRLPELLNALRDPILIHLPIAPRLHPLRPFPRSPIELHAISVQQPREHVHIPSPIQLRCVRLSRHPQACAPARRAMHAQVKREKPLTRVPERGGAVRLVDCIHVRSQGESPPPRPSGNDERDQGDGVTLFARNKRKDICWECAERNREDSR